MRIRTIKPEFWHHPVICRLPDDVQLIALGLLSAADDEGYFRADPQIIRADIAPFRDDLARLSRILSELSRVGWITLASDPEQGPIGKITNWEKHQKVDHPSPSKLKSYFLVNHSRETREEYREDQGSGIRDQGSRIKEGFVGNGCGNGIGDTTSLGVIRRRVNHLMKRDQAAHWANDEEFYLVEVSRREHAVDELGELECFFNTGTYLPQKVITLLSGWTGHLDRARNHHENAIRNRPKGFDRSAGTANAGRASQYSRENREKPKAVHVENEVPKANTGTPTSL